MAAACDSRTATTPSVVKFVLHLLDLSSRTILICQESFQFGPGELLACSIPIGWAYAFHQDKASTVRVPVANVTLFSLFPLFATGVSLGPGFLLRLSAFAMAAACDSRTATTPSVISCRMEALVIAGVADEQFGGGVIDLTGDEDPTDEDGDDEMDDSTGVSKSL
nr:hypothetical protein [Tanacetum cinerariifolium]